MKKEGKADGRTAGKLEETVRESLRRLINDGLGSVECVAERNGKNRIDYRVTVTRPDGSAMLIKEAWSAV